MVDAWSVSLQASLIHYTSSQQSNNIRRAKQAVQDGQYSKAIKALTSVGLATPTPEILQEMLRKHPQGIAPTVILKAVRSFPTGSAPGPSGLRPSHLREAVECPSSDRATLMLSSLSKFVNLLAAGHAPSSVLPHFCGATLLALLKKSGGHRPITVGLVSASVQVPRLHHSPVSHLSTRATAVGGLC